MVVKQKNSQEELESGYICKALYTDVHKKVQLGQRYVFCVHFRLLLNEIQISLFSVAGRYRLFYVRTNRR